MNAMQRVTWRVVWWGWPLLALMAGCAGVDVLKPDRTFDDRQEQRRQEVASAFEQKREQAEFQSAQECFDRNDLEGCRQRLQAMLTRNPEHAEARMLMNALEHPGDVQAVSYDEGDGGADFAGYATVSDIQAADDLLYRGHAALEEGRFDEALTRFQEASASEPDNPQVPISAATALLRSHQPHYALAVVNSAVERWPNSAALRRIAGVAHYRLRDYQSSQVALQQALSLDKSSALTYLLMGCTLVKLGQTEAAEDSFRKAAAIDPSYATRR